MLLFVNSCTQKKSPPDDYVARVNNSYLYTKNLKYMINENEDIKNRSDLIYDWIDNELMYQQALALKIIPNDEFNFIAENQKKRLAAGYLIEKVIKDSIGKYKFNDEAVYNFYLNNQKEFIANDKIYEVIIFSFDNITDAQDFIQKFNENDVKDKEKIFFYESELAYDIKNIFQKTEIKNLSKIIKKEGKYRIYYINDIVEPMSVKKFAMVRDDAKKIYENRVRKSIISNYIRSLYQNNKIELKLYPGN